MSAPKVTQLGKISDDAILAAVRHGARIHVIARRLDLPQRNHASLRRRLQRLEADQQLHRPARLQYDNSYFWQVPE